MFYIVLYSLFILVAAGALAALLIKDLLSSVIALGAAGLCLSAAFVFLGAFDLAMVQLVFEIIVLVILAVALSKKETALSAKTGPDYLILSIFLGFSAGLLAIMYQAFRELPKFGKPLMKISKTLLENSYNQTGSDNALNAILLDFRAIDSLGAIAVLFCALIGALAILREPGKAGKK